jgi:hypothetical protein
VFELLLIWIGKGLYVQISSIKGFESNAYYVFDIMMRFLDIENSVMKSMSFDIEKLVTKSYVFKN